MNFIKFTQHSKEFKILSLFLTFLTIVPAKAQWSKYPTVNTPVCQEGSEQLAPAIIADGTGGTIMTWYDKRPGKTYDIYAQKLDALGNPQWATDGILVCDSKGDQVLPRITTDGDGGAIIAWIDLNSGYEEIFAQRISSSGNPEWSTNGVSISTFAAAKSNFRIETDHDNGAVIVWQDMRNKGADIYAQRIDAKGNVQWTVDGTEICTAANDQMKPRIVTFGDTSVIVWEDGRNTGKGGTGYDIYTQAIRNNGTLLWTSNGEAVCVASADQLTPAIVNDDSSGVIITWADARNTGNIDVYAQRISNGGTSLWLTNGTSVSSATADQTNPEITTDGLHGAIIAWIDTRSGGTHVYTQRINLSGSQRWASSGVALCTSAGKRTNPLIVSDKSKGAIIVWSDIRSSVSYDVYAQKVNLTGTIQWTTNGQIIGSAVNDQSAYDIANDDFGGAVITWSDLRTGDPDIYAQNILREGGLGIVSEISVRGNFLLIPDNDNTPSFSDNTDFGSVSSLITLKKSFKIYNSGNESLEITDIYTTGTHKSEFVPEKLKYPLSVSPGDSLSFYIAYAPLNIGTSNAILNIDNNDSNESVYNFTLKGLFKSPEIDIKGNNVSIINGDKSPADTDSTDYGKVRMGRTSLKTYTILNAGTDTLKITNLVMAGTHSADFTFPSIVFPKKVAPGKTLLVPVTFTPGAQGLRQASMKITNNDPDEPDYEFSVQGAGILPVIRITGNHTNIADGDKTPSVGDRTDYGKVHISGQKTQTFKVFNSGTDALKISNISISGTHMFDFSVAAMSFPVTLNAGDSMDLDVKFSPLTLGARSAEVIIDSDDDASASFDFAVRAVSISQEVEVKGRGRHIMKGNTTISTNDNTSFGMIKRNASKTQRFYVVNTGTDVLAVTNIALSGPDAASFTLGALTPAAPVAEGDSSYFEVTFNPVTNGIKTATVTITNNDADEALYDFAIQGSAQSSKISVKGNHISIADGTTTVSASDNTDFGSVELPNTVTKTFRIYNTGNDVLSVSGISVSGAHAADFALQGITFPKAIAAGDSATFEVKFSPSVKGIKNAVITVNSDEMDIMAYDFAVEGAATEKQVGIAENQLNNTVFCYPNPANELVYINLPQTAINCAVRIISADGKRVSAQAGISAVNNNVDVSGLATGIYTLQIEVDGITITKKLAINR